MAEEPLLSISEASRVLGVSEASLRQWTDERKVKAFVTPGGHRRYARAELKRFMNSQLKPVGMKDLAVQLEDTAAQHREIDHNFLTTTDWYDRLDEDSRKQLPELGRRLLSLIVRYVTEPSRRKDTLEASRQVGRGLGETLAAAQLPLTDAVEGFVLHRGPIIQATTHLIKSNESGTGRVVDAIPLVMKVMDEALVALVAAHQNYGKENSEKRTENVIEGGLPL